MTVLGVATVVVALVLLAGAVMLLDRQCVALAERRAAAHLAVPLGRPPVVRVHGRPFLTQALRGRYRAVHVAGTGLRIGEMNGVALDAQLRNVYLPLRDLLGGRTEEVPCEHIEGRLVLPYDELARAARIPGLELRPSRGRVLATAALPVPGISQLARVTGRAVLTLAEGNAVWLQVRGVSVAGINVPSIVLGPLLPSLDVPIAMPVLPYGLRLDELRPEDDGLVVLASADAVVFRRLAVEPVPGRPLPPVRPTARDARPDR
ncbi:Protein of unknown function [Jatrophihabitans endophyticus]|uniref:DUF2993 domain-containing protein n=1 Tax=Jatrophihabitans endophyticus TaxID=1206085 RepID=A0A1M5IAT1_9ACTN|nr:DUF2993 domain-containing protein [Jatrophihabitans endophyticus]SHG25335.1 Protein of unknown function [Jatrophihabitans endophyticus]